MNDRENGTRNDANYEVEFTFHTPDKGLIHLKRLTMAAAMELYMAYCRTSPCKGATVYHNGERVLAQGRNF
jgi:hypothetical protein